MGAISVFLMVGGLWMVGGYYCWSCGWGVIVLINEVGVGFILEILIWLARLFIAVL